MNKDKILEVAEIMEKRGKVNMGSYFEGVSKKGSCATPGCIAGTTAAMEGWKPIGCQTMVYHEEDPSTVRPVQKVAAEILGLHDALAKRLFFPRFDQVSNYKKVPARQVAAVLRLLAEKGYVNWGKFRHSNKAFQRRQGVWGIKS